MSFFTTADCASASRVTLCSRPWETRLQARLQSTLRSYMFSGAPSELGVPRHRSRRNSLPTPLAAPGARGEGHIASGATASHARRLRQPRQSTPRSPRTFRVAPRRARSAPKAASLNAPAPPAPPGRTIGHAGGPRGHAHGAGGWQEQGRRTDHVEVVGRAHEEDEGQRVRGQSTSSAPASGSLSAHAPPASHLAFKRGTAPV